MLDTACRNVAWRSLAALLLTISAIFAGTFVLPGAAFANRSGAGNLNSALGGNSGHDAGRDGPATGVFDGYEEVGAAHPPHAHPPAFKVQVALAALREDKTLADLAKQFRAAPQPDHGVEAAVG